MEEKSESLKQLEGTVEAHVRDVTRLAKSAGGAMPETMDNIDNWVESNVLEVRRGQSHADGAWKTMDYELLLGFGGPNVYFDTRACEVQGFWGGDEVKRHVDKDVCRVFEDHFDEVLPE